MGEDQEGKRGVSALHPSEDLSSLQETQKKPTLKKREENRVPAGRESCLEKTSRACSRAAGPGREFAGRIEEGSLLLHIRLIQKQRGGHVGRGTVGSGGQMSKESL